MNRILLVEDEINVRKPLAEYLRSEGFRVSEAGTGAEAEAILNDEKSPVPELIILDWMLPDLQGIELLKRWRKRGVETPTLLLSARSEVVDKVLGLELGANDYVTKPFEPRELVARIRVQLRMREAATAMVSGPRSMAAKDTSLRAGGFHLDETTHSVLFEGQDVELTKTEFRLLRIFLEHPGQVFSREELLRNVWGYDSSPTTRTVDTHVLQLRQKSRSELFETVHGIGYRFRAGKFAKGFTSA